MKLLPPSTTTATTYDHQEVTMKNQISEQQHTNVVAVHPKPRSISLFKSLIRFS